MEILKHYKTRSREVKPEDLERIVDIGFDMCEECEVPHGYQKSGFAIAHMQVCGEDDDPLRFFVTKDGDVFINPKITKRYGDEKRMEEGCLSYPDKHRASILRHKKIDVEYETLNESVDGSDKKFKKETNTVEGLMAQIFQHEIDHMNGISVWEK